MFAIRFQNGDESENDKYYGPYKSLEECLQDAPRIVKKGLELMDFEDEYGPEDDEYKSDEDPAETVRKYDAKHEGLFPMSKYYSAQTADYPTVDNFYITSETLINILRQDIYQPASFHSFSVITLEHLV